MCLQNIRSTIPESRSRRKMLRFPWLWILIPAVFVLAGPVAWAYDCAFNVDAKQETLVSYKQRGDRCEGVYDQPIANRINLRIVGFHLNWPVFDPLKDDLLRIFVKPHQAGRRVLLKIVSTRRHQNFRMDTSAIAADGSFTWKMDVVRQMREPLQPFDTAALACVSECEGGPLKRATLLPVSFSSVSSDGSAPALTLLAITDVELGQLTATLRQGDRVIFEDLAVGGTYLPPHNQIRISIQGAAPGEALLSLSAVTKGNQRDYLEAKLVIPMWDK